MSEEDEKTQAWGTRHGLRWREVNAGPHNFTYLVEPAQQELARRLARDLDDSDVFDHSRGFVKRMPRVGYPAKYWAIITNPYTHSLLRRYGSEEARDAAIRDVAGKLGLRVRIDNDADTTYWGKLPTTPILWWNPDRFNPVEIEQNASRRAQAVER